MGQDPNQPYPSQYGQPSGAPPPPPYTGGYQQPSSYPPPNPGYQQQGYPPPNPGYQQQQQQGYQYQQSYGQPGPMFYVGHPNGPSTMNMEPNTAAGLSYFTWIAGLIFFLSEKHNRFVRFNAMQELLLTGVFVVPLLFFSVIPILNLLFVPLIALGGFAVWIICVINAFQGRYFKLPVLGDYAERFANSSTPGMM